MPPLKDLKKYCDIDGREPNIEKMEVNRMEVLILTQCVPPVALSPLSKLSSLSLQLQLVHDCHRAPARLGAVFATGTRAAAVCLMLHAAPSPTLCRALSSKATP